MRRICFFLIQWILLVTVLQGREADEKTLSPEVLLGLRGLGDLQVSPDNGWVAFVVSEPADTTEEGNPQQRDIWIVSTDGGGEARPFALGEKDEFSPRWSPDGKQIAFLSNRGEEGKAQVYLIRFDGGEGYGLTRMQQGVQAFAWSPDGKEIAFVTQDSLTAEEEKKQKEKYDEIVVDRADKVSRLWIVDVESRAMRAVSPEGVHVSEFAWSPDGSRFALRVSDTPRNDDVYWHSRLVVMERSGGQLQELARRASGNVRWSPDARRIFFFYPSERLAIPIPAVFQMETAMIQKFAKEYDGTFWDVAWLPDSRRVLGAVQKGVQGGLMTLDVRTGRIDKIVQTFWRFTGSRFCLSRDGKCVAYLSGSPDRPEDVWWCELTSKKRTRLTDFYGCLDAYDVGRAETVVWKNKDGREVQGVLIKPAGFEEGKRYPLVVAIHGGPAWAWWLGWHGTWHEWGHFLASHGYLVLLPNPRGSRGYGVAFAEANADDWGGGDYEDIVSGVDDLVNKGLVDPERLGVGGWSYGGFMTSWIVTHTNRFKAAVCGAGVTNLFSFHGTTDITPTFLKNYFTDVAYRRKEAYDAHSAVCFVENAKTPTLVLHGDEDVRVPVSQGWEFYRGLKQMGVETEMVVYPREGHSFREYGHQLDLLRRVLDWFDGYLKP